MNPERPLPSHHLAQANIARMRAPLDDPLMAGFVAQLEAVNRLADETPGFVWRFQTDAGDATGYQAYEDPLILWNLSVWTSVEALRDYVYRSRHGEAFRQRADWFEPLGKSSYVLWWIPAGTIPGIDEGKSRLERLWSIGPTPEGFLFKPTFPPPHGP